MKNVLKIEGYELLSKKVYRVLKTEIIKGSLKIGSKLFEGKIAEQMAISRTPVREAFRELAAKGFVKITKNHGATISDYSIEDIQEILQIRKVLEGLTARLVATIIEEEEIKEAEKLVKQMGHLVNKRDVLTFAEIATKLHGLILNIYGNKQLIRIYDDLNDLIYRFRIKSLSVPGRLKYSLAEHKNIVEALKKGDSDQADKLSQIHVENVLKNILVHTKKTKSRK